MKKVLYYGIFFVIILILVVGYCYGNSVTISDENYLSLYESVVDTVVAEYAGSDYEYIAVDANSFNVSGLVEQQEMIQYLKKYNTNIVIGSYNMIKNDSYFVNEDGSLKGLLITVNNIKYVGNMVSMNIQGKKSNLDGKGKYVKATYSFGRWNLKVINNYVN